MWEKVQTDDTPSTTTTRKASVKNKLVSQEGHFSGQGSLQNVQKYKGMGINVRKDIGESYFQQKDKSQSYFLQYISFALDEND